MKHMLRIFQTRLCTAIALFLLGSCAHLSAPTELDRVIAEEEIRIAFLKSSLAGMPSTYSYFICIDGSAPSDHLISSLSAIPPRVRMCSESLDSEKQRLEGESRSNRVFRMTLGKIKWVSNVEVEFSSSYYLGRLAGGGSTIIMKYIDGAWQVTQSRSDWAA